MRYIFDSSAIFAAIQLGVGEKVIGGYTTTLAKYELGNIILKEGTIHKRLTAQEQDKLLLAAEHLLKLMQLLDVDGASIKVLETARELKLSFYDAYYLYYSKAMKLPLITEDLKLARKTENVVKSYRTNEM